MPRRFDDGFAKAGLVGLDTFRNAFIKYTAHDARIGNLRIADLSGFVDFLVSKARFHRRWNLLLIWKKVSALPLFANLPGSLRRIIFIGQPALRHALDFQSIGLGAVN